MPPFMAQSNRWPLTLTHWQYDLLMAWADDLVAAGGARVARGSRRRGARRRPRPSPRCRCTRRSAGRQVLAVRANQDGTGDRACARARLLPGRRARLVCAAPRSSTVPGRVQVRRHRPRALVWRTVTASGSTSCRRSRRRASRSTSRRRATWPRLLLRRPRPLRRGAARRDARRHGRGRRRRPARRVRPRRPGHGRLPRRRAVPARGARAPGRRVREAGRRAGPADRLLGHHQRHPAAGGRPRPRAVAALRAHGQHRRRPRHPRPAAAQPARRRHLRRRDPRRRPAAHRPRPGHDHGAGHRHRRPPRSHRSLRRVDGARDWGGSGSPRCGWASARSTTPTGRPGPRRRSPWPSASWPPSWPAANRVRQLRDRAAAAARRVGRPVPVRRGRRRRLRRHRRALVRLPPRDRQRRTPSVAPIGRSIPPASRRSSPPGTSTVSNLAAAAGPCTCAAAAATRRHPRGPTRRATRSARGWSSASTPTARSRARGPTGSAPFPPPSGLARRCPMPADKLQPRNRTARLAQARAAGNPVTTELESGVGNCFPGLEADLRNLERRFFPYLAVDFTSGVIAVAEVALARAQTELAPGPLLTGLSTVAAGPAGAWQVTRIAGDFAGFGQQSYLVTQLGDQHGPSDRRLDGGPAAAAGHNRDPHPATRGRARGHPRRDPRVVPHRRRRVRRDVRPGRAHPVPVLAVDARLPRLRLLLLGVEPSRHRAACRSRPGPPRTTPTGPTGSTGCAGTAPPRHRHRSEPEPRGRAAPPGDQLPVAGARRRPGRARAARALRPGHGRRPPAPPRRPGADAAVRGGRRAGRHARVSRRGLLARPRGRRRRLDRRATTPGPPLRAAAGSPRRRCGTCARSTGCSSTSTRPPAPPAPFTPALGVATVVPEPAGAPGRPVAFHPLTPDVLAYFVQVEAPSKTVDALYGAHPRRRTTGTGRTPRRRRWRR